MELALRVDNEETVVPKQYPESLQAQRLSAQTGPGPTCDKRTTRNGGLELTKRTPIHEWCFPKRTLGAESAPLGAHESTKEQPTSSTRTGTLLKQPGSQSDAAAARRRGAGGGRPSAGSALVTRIARHGHPAWQPSLPHHSSTTLIRRPRLIDSEKRLPSASRRFRTQPQGSTNAWNFDSDKCRTQEARTQPRAPRGKGGATPGP